jgi:hypothetical protein
MDQAINEIIGYVVKWAAALVAAGGGGALVAYGLFQQTGKK